VLGRALGRVLGRTWAVMPRALRHWSGKRPFTLALLAFAMLLAPRARADSPFDGKWKQGPLKEEYTVQKWMSACGPAPVSGSVGGGETISVHEEGDELAFVGGGRVYRTNQCYDQLPTLVRETHTRDPSGRSWRTRCTTPPSDPRRAFMNTLVAASSDTHIDIAETGRYEISLSEGVCMADVKRSRGFDVIAKDAPAGSNPVAAVATAPTPTTAAAPADQNRCSSPGAPARLEVRPSRKLVRSGDSFAFRALVLDGNGCITRTPTSWAVAEGPDAANGVTVDATGKVLVPADGAEGTFDVVVSAAGKSAKVTVEVASPSRYDELLAQSGLNDAGESEAAAVAVIATGSIGGSDAKAEDGGRRRKAIFIAIVAAVALALGIVAVVGARRSRRAAALEREAQERHKERLREVEARNKEKLDTYQAALKAHEESVKKAAALAASGTNPPPAEAKLVCPACRREYPAGTSYCAQDSNRLVPMQPGEDPLTGPMGGICPTCKRGFDPGVKLCPHDNDELVPYALYASRNPSANPPARGKICPTCGGRFEGGASFCGKDGTALVLLN
jgi:hypothetical protein